LKIPLVSTESAYGAKSHSQLNLNRIKAAQSQTKPRGAACRIRKGGRHCANKPPENKTPKKLSVLAAEIIRALDEKEHRLKAQNSPDNPT
jgi:hypothetical protein